MWKIKTVETAKNDNIKVEGDKLMTKLIMIFSSAGKDDETYSTVVQTEGEVHATIASIEARLNERDAFQSKDFSKYVAPVPPAPVEPTAEELEAQVRAQKEAHLMEVVEKAKRDKEIQALALKVPEVATALAEVMALETKNVINKG